MTTNTTARVTFSGQYNGYFFLLDGKPTAPFDIPRDALQQTDLGALLHDVTVSDMPDELRDAAGKNVLRFMARRATRINVEARRWFSRGQGNTYHSVVVTDADTNRTLVNAGIAWGYDRQYMKTALDGLARAMGEEPNDTHAHSRWLDAHGIELAIENVTDVKRKRDL